MEHKELKIDVAAVAKQALRERQPGEDLDEALLRTCKGMYRESGPMAFQATQGCVRAITEKGNFDSESALRKISTGDADIKVTSVIRTQKVSLRSLDELPSDLRPEVEKALASGQSGPFVITKTVSGRQQALPSTAIKGEGLPADRCRYCGYELSSDWPSCPQCGRPQKRSFWSRPFGK